MSWPCCCSGTKDFTLLVNYDALYFASNFDGLNLDHVATVPFAPLTTSLATPPTQVPSTNTSSPPAPAPLSTTPTTNTFNYKALPSNVLDRYNEYQNPNTIMQVNNMIPFVWPNYSVCNNYANPLVLGHHVILRNSTVLEGVRDFKVFSKEPPICNDVTSAQLRACYREFTNHALSCGYFVMPY
jgi:hypothetical protein